jgi:hypothetical protein
MQLIRENPEITEKQIGEITGWGTSKITPTRIRLWEAGEIEPSSDQGWKDALANRPKNVGWSVVQDQAARQDIGERAKTRPARNAKSAEERAKRIVADLEDPTVNRLVLAMTKDGAGSRRAQRHVEQTLRKQHMERRQQARQAERDKGADADFKRMLKHLWDARGAVAAIDAHLIQERARVANAEQRVIPDDIRTIIKSLGSMWQNVRDLGDPNERCPVCGVAQVDDTRHLRAFAMDAEVVEISDSDEEIVEADVVSS